MQSGGAKSAGGRESYQEDSHDWLETPSRIVRVLPRANGLTCYGIRFEG